MLAENVEFLNSNADKIPGSIRLRELSELNSLQLEQLQGVTSNKDEKANATRKRFREYQIQVDQQQKLAPPE